MSKFTATPWHIGQQFRGMDRYNYAVCGVDDVPIPATLENIAVQAAAPEMYEALKVARVYVEWCAKRDGWAKNTDTDLQAIDAALAKAVGK